MGGYYLDHNWRELWLAATLLMLGSQKLRGQIHMNSAGGRESSTSDGIVMERASNSIHPLATLACRG